MKASDFALRATTGQVRLRQGFDGIKWRAKGVRIQEIALSRKVKATSRYMMTASKHPDVLMPQPSDVIPMKACPLGGGGGDPGMAFC